MKLTGQAEAVPAATSPQLPAQAIRPSPKAAPVIPGNPRPQLAPPQQTAHGVAAPTGLTPAQVLMAHPEVRDRVIARLQQIERVLGRAAGEPANVADLRTSVRNSEQLVASGSYDAAVKALVALEANAGRLSAAGPVRTMFTVINTDLRYPDRAAADVPSRYAQYVREYAALQGNGSADNTDTTIWSQLSNAATNLMFDVVPVNGKTLMKSLEEHDQLPPAMAKQWDAVRARVSSADALVREGAAMVHAYAHSDTGDKAHIVCRDAAELFRKLMVSAHIDARVEPFTSPFGHAYAIVSLRGGELLVDPYFHPAGAIIMSRSEVEEHGFGTPDSASAPRH